MTQPTRRQTEAAAQLVASGTPPREAARITGLDPDNAKRTLRRHLDTSDREAWDQLNANARTRAALDGGDRG